MLEEAFAILRLNELGPNGFPESLGQPQHGEGLHRGERLFAAPVAGIEERRAGGSGLAKGRSSRT